MRLKNTIALVCLSMLVVEAAGALEHALRSAIAQILKTAEAHVGVAIKDLHSGDTLTFNGNGHFPMQSVYKFQVALAVLHHVDQHKISLEQQIHVTEKDLRENTWSPLREKYPEGGVDVSIRELLEYMVSQSDNNACDILFSLIGGPQATQAFIRQLGINDMAIAATEEEMHANWDVQYKNWSTPTAMMELLELFHTRDIISKPHHDLLWKMMVDTSTGPRRIKGLLPAGTVIAHKTGTGALSDDGIISAVNDVGIVSLPGNKDVIIVVFVTDSKEDFRKTEEVIARIGKVAYDYFLK